MLSWWRAQTRIGRTASKIYGSIVAAARRREFYADYGVPDTKEGRFAMLVVHMFLVLERLRQEGEQGAALSRATTEAFVTDMDDILREIGIGDLSVPRHVKQSTGALYDCVRQYREALGAKGEGALTEALERTLLPDSRSVASAVASYVRRAAEVIASAPASSIIEGQFAFPSP